MCVFFYRYNSRVEEWERSGLVELRNMSFSLFHNNASSEFNLVSEGFGEYYPYRDSCNKLSDPKCKNSTVNYYSLLVPAVEKEDFSFKIVAQDRSVLFEETLECSSTAYLNKMEINCSGGNRWG